MPQHQPRSRPVGRDREFDSSANQAGDEVDRTTNDRYAEHVRQESVGEHCAPDTSIAHSGIGHLVAHADRECDVGEVAVRGSLRSVCVFERDARVPPDPAVWSAYRRVKTVLTTVHDSMTVITARPTSSTRSGPLCRPARMRAKPTPRRLATLAPSNNAVAEPRVSSSRLASCTTWPLSARRMIGQTLRRKTSAAESQPATTAIPPRYEPRKHNYDD
jgi:hypothetical protein